MTRSIIHPKLHTRLTQHFYTSTCTIQQNTPAADGVGQLQASWANLADHVDIDCAVAVATGSRGEIRQPDQTVVVASHVIALAGYYPSITEQMRAVVAGVNYNILLVQHDSQGKSTSLLVEKVT